MNNPLIVGLTGLCIGVLAACSEVATEKESSRVPAQVDPVTHIAFCYECPMPAAGQATAMTREPIADTETGILYCPPCEDTGYCGDDWCNSDETCDSCSYDCGACSPPTWCGDGACNGGETSTNCPADCGSSSGAVLGRFTLYCGKVNSHQSPGGNWMTDPDCTSGCNIGGLSYCRKFWPGSTGIRQVAVSSKPNNVWTNAGCGPVIDDWDGNEEFECINGSAPSDSITIIYANVPITYEINNAILRFNSEEDLRTAIDQLDADYESYNASYENMYSHLTIEQMDIVDELNGFDEFMPYKNMEQRLPGFVSKRSQIEATEQRWLITDLPSDDPDLYDLTFDDAENTLFNANYEIKIGATVYRMTEAGMIDTSGMPLAVFSGGLSRKIEDERPVAAFSGCKRHGGAIWPKFEGDRKWRFKLRFFSALARWHAKAKMVSFKRNGNGWKRSRDQLAVIVGGSVYNMFCASPRYVFGSKPSSGFRRRKSLKVGIDGLGILNSTKSGELFGRFSTPSFDEVRFLP